MDWRACGRWFVWPAILLWVLLWHVGPLPLGWHFRRAYAADGDLLPMVMLPAYVAAFGAIFGLMHGPPHARPLWRLVLKIVPLALLAGAIDELLLYPQGLWGPEPLTTDRVLRAATSVSVGGAVRAVIFLVPMTLGAHVARYRLGPYVLGVVGMAAASVITVVSLLQWWMLALP